MSDKPPPSDARARREAELAQALRANLRRRKGPGDPAADPAAQTPPKEEGEREAPPLPRPQVGR